MRVLSSLVCVAFLILTVPALAQTSPTRQPQGISILQQSLAAMGGASIGSVNDFTASGTVTYFWGSGPLEAPATAKGLGVADFRLDSDLPNGQQSLVATRASGSLKKPDGTTIPIPWEESVNLLSATLPGPVILAALSNTDFVVKADGKVTFHGQAAYKVEIEQIISSAVDPKGTFSALTKRGLFIDASSYLVLGVEDELRPSDSAEPARHHELLYSDYRDVNGVAVPFSVTETVSGQRTWAFALSSISFNTGLTAADFAQ